ncbi:hypothetical protein DYB28_006440 [Aphanomyces astaci]|uniref:Retrotransposon gag domain-containing protein n=1 Tax=Aphanomyces astaci TaxID=112090 RepID=A0A9X8E8K5_APHAT|nr:hypothetical protein DYB28_006440 [Aphanomyces astaci]
MDETLRTSVTEKIAWFPSYLSKTVRAWFNQLQPHYKHSWKDIKRNFGKEWITNPLPKADKYYHMTQEPKEPLKTFFYRFNSAGQSARMEYWKSASKLEDHIGRLFMALEDESLGDRLSQMVFSSIDDLLGPRRRGQTCHTAALRGESWIDELLQGNVRRFRNQLRMLPADKHKNDFNEVVGR